MNILYLQHHNNGVAERAFVTDLWKLKAMVKQAQFAQKARNMLWTYGIKVLEKLGITAMTSANPGNTSPDAMFGCEQVKIAHHLIEFGKIGFVTDRTPIRG